MIPTILQNQPNSTLPHLRRITRISSHNSHSPKLTTLRKTRNGSLRIIKQQIHTIRIQTPRRQNMIQTHQPIQSPNRRTNPPHRHPTTRQPRQNHRLRQTNKRNRRTKPTLRRNIRNQTITLRPPRQSLTRHPHNPSRLSHRIQRKPKTNHLIPRSHDRKPSLLLNQAYRSNRSTPGLSTPAKGVAGGLFERNRHRP